MNIKTPKLCLFSTKKTTALCLFSTKKTVLVPKYESHEQKLSTDFKALPKTNKNAMRWHYQFHLNIKLFLMPKGRKFKPSHTNDKVL